MSNSSMGSKLIKILGILVLVAAVVGVGILLFSCNSKVVDDSAAKKGVEITNTENFKSFNQNIKNDYDLVQSSELTDYVESFKSTDATLYNNFTNAHLSYMAQWAIVNSLINDTAFGGKKGAVEGIVNSLSNFEQAMTNTLGAVNVFNQDKQSGANDVTLKAEVGTIVNRLNSVNNQLLNLSQQLVNFAIDNLGGVKNITTDLKVVLTNALYYQIENYQKVLTKIITDADRTSIEKQKEDVVSALKANLFALNNDYVYSDINSTTSIKVEEFLATYKSVNNVNDFIKSDNKEDFISKIKDNTQKDKLNSIWQFVKELAQEAI